MAASPHPSPSLPHRSKKSRLAVLRKKSAAKSPKRMALGLGVNQPQPLSLTDAAHSAPTTATRASITFHGSRTPVIRSQSHKAVSAAMSGTNTTNSSGTQIAINSILLDGNSVMPRDRKSNNHLIPQLIHQQQQQQQQQLAPPQALPTTTMDTQSRVTIDMDAHIKRLVTPSPYCSDDEASSSSAESDVLAREREIRRKCDELTSKETSHSNVSNGHSGGDNGGDNSNSKNNGNSSSMRRPRSMSAVSEIEKQSNSHDVQSPNHSHTTAPSIESESEPRLTTAADTCGGSSGGGTGGGGVKQTRHLFRRPSTEIVAPSTTTTTQQQQQRINVHVSHSRGIDSAEISPSSSVGTNPSTLSVQSHPHPHRTRARHSSIDLRYATCDSRPRSASLNSDELDVVLSSTVPSSAGMVPSVVPETSAVLRNEDGLLTYIGEDASCSNPHRTASRSPSNLPRVKSMQSMRRNTSGSSTYARNTSHSQLSSLSTQDRNRRRTRIGRGCGSGRSIGHGRLGGGNASGGGGVSLPQQQQQQDMPRHPKKPAAATKTTNGVLCHMQLESPWDCLTVSRDQQWMAVFGRSAMALLRITENGTFEQMRDLKANKNVSGGQLKYGAIDAEFNAMDSCKLVSSTRNSVLYNINFNYSGRGCYSVSNCRLSQRANKVTWLPAHTCQVLAASDDGNCYLWDTRTPATLHNGVFNGGSVFVQRSSAVSVKVSPFNAHLFASAHKNGTVHVWDTRQCAAPFVTLTAHNPDAKCIDWHPKIPNVLATCGYQDVTIKVWNLSLDESAQRTYGAYASALNQSRQVHREYNNEDDYRLSMGASSSSQEFHHHPPSSSSSSYDFGDDAYDDGPLSMLSLPRGTSQLRPNCAMYPCGQVLQIGWRPCYDARSLSANQIACSYVSGEVVDLWDITSAYVPVASWPSHGETKFEFLLRDRPFLSRDDGDADADENENEEVDGDSNNAKTYLITCSKDKSIKLTDCGYADIPRSHLSNCALDIAPFGDSCFVSVARQKLHPFDRETYFRHHDDDDDDDVPEGGETSTLVTADRDSDDDQAVLDRNARRNAMAGGFRQHELDQLTNILKRGHVDAFSEYETKLSCCSLNDTQPPRTSTDFGASPSDCADDFRYLAKHYKLSGPSIAWICQQNAKVAQNINDNELAQLWSLLAVLLNDVLSSNRAQPQKQSSKPSSNAVQLFSPGMNAGFDEEDDDDDDDYEVLEDMNTAAATAGDSNTSNNDDGDGDEDDIDSMDEWWMTEPRQQGQSPSHSNANSNSALSMYSNSNVSNTQSHRVLENAVLPIVTSSAAAAAVVVNHGGGGGADAHDADADGDGGAASMVANYVQEVLAENIERGDIQTAATIVVILKDYILQYLAEHEICDIILSYLDLLVHDRLLREAVKIYELNKRYPLVVQHFVGAAQRLIVKCVKCKGLMRDNVCFRCNKFSFCSACYEAFDCKNKNAIPQLRWQKQLKHPTFLIWCQICGHGGHYDHLIDWFESKQPCLIETCAHQCLPVLIPIDV